MLKKNYTNFNNLNVSLRYKINLNKQPYLNIKIKKDF